MTALTVAELISRLSSLPPEMPVAALYAAECAGGDIAGLRAEQMPGIDGAPRDCATH